MYQLTTIGLIAYVDLTPQGGWALLPNGLNPESGIAKHFARFHIEKNRIVADQTDWWPATLPNPLPDVMTCFEMLEPVDLTFTGMQEQQPMRASEVITSEKQSLRLQGDPNDLLGRWDLDASRYTPYIASLKDLDRNFKVDMEAADVIARFRVHHATMYAHRLAKSAVTTMFVRTNDGPVTIKATTRSGEMKRITVTDGTEIVLSNMSLLGAHEDEQGPSHINLYRRLDPQSKRLLPEPKLHPALTPLYGPSRHPFIWYIRQQFGDVPRPGCSGLRYSSSSSPTGCRPW